MVLHKDLREISRFNFEEGKKEKIEFDQSQHKASSSCSLRFQNKFWIFGGQRSMKRVSVLNSCSLELFKFNGKVIKLPEWKKYLKFNYSFIKSLIIYMENIASDLTTMWH